MLNKQALHKKVFERMKAEVPQSRAYLGGYHTGKRDAYLNVISDLQSGEFDAPSDDRLRAALERMQTEPSPQPNQNANAAEQADIT